MINTVSFTHQHCSLNKQHTDATTMWTQKRKKSLSAPITKPWPMPENRGATPEEVLSKKWQSAFRDFPFILSNFPTPHRGECWTMASATQAVVHLQIQKGSYFTEEEGRSSGLPPCCLGLRRWEFLFLVCHRLPVWILASLCLVVPPVQWGWQHCPTTQGCCVANHIKKTMRLSDTMVMREPDK